MRVRNHRLDGHGVRDALIAVALLLLIVAIGIGKVYASIVYHTWLYRRAIAAERAAS